MKIAESSYPLSTIDSTQPLLKKVSKTSWNMFNSSDKKWKESQKRNKESSQNWWWKMRKEAAVQQDRRQPYHLPQQTWWTCSSLHQCSLMEWWPHHKFSQVWCHNPRWCQWCQLTVVLVKVACLAVECILKCNHSIHSGLWWLQGLEDISSLLMFNLSIKHRDQSSNNQLFHLLR